MRAKKNYYFLKPVLGVIFTFWLSFNFLFAYTLPVWAVGANMPVTGKQDCLTSGKCSECETTQREIECRKQFLFQEGGYAGATSFGWVCSISKESCETNDDCAPEEGTCVKGSATIAGRIGVLVDTVMSITGIVFLAIVVFSGIQWMVAGGNEETVKKAKTRIGNAVIGLVIVVGAWAIINFVLTSLIFPGQAVSGWGPFSWKTY